MLSGRSKESLEFELGSWVVQRVRKANDQTACYWALDLQAYIPDLDKVWLDLREGHPSIPLVRRIGESLLKLPPPEKVHSILSYRVSQFSKYYYSKKKGIVLVL